MKLAVVASLIAGASAFLPSAEKSSSTTALSAVKKAPVKKVAAKKGLSFANEIGVQAPLDFWDPLGYLNGATQEEFNKLRYLEIKHGRVAQLAFVGFITTEFGYRLPGAISLDGTTFESIPSGFGAVYAMPGAGLAQILAFAGYLEFFGWKQNENSFPGDFSASSFPVGFLDFAKSEADKTKLRTQELNQGRAAMMGIFSLMIHEGLGVDILPPH